MKEILLQYAGYNIWANKKIIETLLQLEKQKLDLEIESSFSSIHKTVYHVWSAEYVWLQRLQLAEHAVWMESTFNGSFEEACERWLNASSQLYDFVSKQYDDKAFAHVFQYYNLKKQSVKMPVRDVLMQVFNHSTYHRGQLVTMMRLCGMNKIPGTDFITFIGK